MPSCLNSEMNLSYVVAIWICTQSPVSCTFIALVDQISLLCSDRFEGKGRIALTMSAAEDRANMARHRLRIDQERAHWN